MKRRKFSLIGLWIVLTLVAAIGIQVYRNLQNYKINQRQLQREIQLCLDNSIETYYAELAKSNVLLTGAKLDSGRVFLKKYRRENNGPKLIINRGQHSGIDSNNVKKQLLPFGAMTDSSTLYFSPDHRKDSLRHGIKIKKDSSGAKEFQEFTQRIIISMIRDTLDFEKLNGYLKQELDRRNITINYGLLHYNRNMHYNRNKVAGGFNQDRLDEFPFKTVSRSTFLPRSQRLELYFENPALAVLQRGFTDMMISLLFLGIISGALWYLYQTIRSQKELAEIKNDLINNITHEFKTPIATVTSALEGIQLFNAANDPLKTRKYLDISNQQLQKLNSMVEKLLETATLDSEHLYLQKEITDLHPMLERLVGRFRSTAKEKKFKLKIPDSPVILKVDPFHFENALSNIMENAVKYGGEQIDITLAQNGQTVILITDNGGFIKPDQKDKVFDQFYRIPQGNRHDIKGFGIGLYYTKKIIEKHGGTIGLELDGQRTTFKITMT